MPDDSTHDVSTHDVSTHDVSSHDVSSHHYAIDRFEDDAWVVLEDAAGRTFPVPRFWLPVAAGEGDVLRLHTDTEFDELEVDEAFSELYFSIDVEETRARRERARGMRDRLPRGPRGDVEL